MKANYRRRVSRVAVGCLLALGALVGGVARGEELTPTVPRWTTKRFDAGQAKKRWLLSLAAVAAANAFDIHSSRGRRELNPMFRTREGKFSTGKALAIKSGLSGGMIAAQWAWIRRHPGKNCYTLFTLKNSIVAGGLGAVAVHNYSLGPRRNPSSQPLVPAYLAAQR